MFYMIQSVISSMFLIIMLTNAMKPFFHFFFIQSHFFIRNQLTPNLLQLHFCNQPMNSLSYDEIEYCFSFLPIFDLSKCTSVCNEWRSLSQRIFNSNPGALLFLRKVSRAKYYMSYLLI